MVYTKKQFANDLKKQISEKKSFESIGRWIYLVYLDWSDVDDINFIDLLLYLNTMELGPEFAFSYEELEHIADDLIAGKEVKL